MVPSICILALLALATVHIGAHDSSQPDCVPAPKPPHSSVAVLLSDHASHQVREDAIQSVEAEAEERARSPVVDVSHLAVRWEARGGRLQEDVCGPRRQAAPVIMLQALGSRIMTVVMPAIGTGYKYGFQIGALCLVVAFFGNGTHSIFAKLAGKDASPVTYTLYLTLGLFLGCTTAIAAMSQPFEVSGPGLLGGGLLAIAVTCYINAIFLVGIVWCDMITASSATITSFLWGKLYFQEPSANAVGALLGLALLLVGITSVSIVLSLRLRGLDRTQRIAQGKALAWGLFLAVFNGICGGSSFPVNKLQPPDKQGVSFVWAQALGALIAQIVVVLLTGCVDMCKCAPTESFVPEGDKQSINDADSDALNTKQHTLVIGRWSPRMMLPLGLGQGAVFAITNLATTIAGLSPTGIGVAQPVRESGHSIAVLIGVFIFHEYGAPDAQFAIGLLACTCLNVGGIVVLLLCGSAPS